jgi:tetratricopeptide (TPR) repeat protein
MDAKLEEHVLMKSKQAEQLFQIGKFSEAEIILSEIHRELANYPSDKRCSHFICLNLNRLGLCSAQQGKINKAIKHFTQGLEQAQLLLSQAQRLASSNDVKKFINDVKDLISGLNCNLAGIYIQTGSYTKAIKLYKKALAMEKEIGNIAGEFFIQIELYDLTIAIIQSYLSGNKKWYQIELDPLVILIILDYLFNRKWYKDAAIFYENALDEIKKKKFNEPEIEAKIQFRLGEIYQIGKAWTEAEAAYRKSADISHAHGDLIRTTMAWDALAELAKIQGKIELAENWFRESIKTERQAGTPMSLFRRLKNLAELLKNQDNRLEDAQLLAEEALTIDDTNTGIYNLLADIAHKQKDSVKEKFYRQLVRENDLRSGKLRLIQKFKLFIKTVLVPVSVITCIILYLLAPQLIIENSINLENFSLHLLDFDKILVISGFLLFLTIPIPNHEHRLLTKSWKKSVLLTKLLTIEGDTEKNTSFLIDKSIDWICSNNLEKKIIGIYTLNLFFKKQCIGYDDGIVKKTREIFEKESSLAVKLAASDFLCTMGINPCFHTQLSADECNRVHYFISENKQIIIKIPQKYYIAIGFIFDIIKEYYFGSTPEQVLKDIVYKIDINNPMQSNFLATIVNIIIVILLIIAFSFPFLVSIPLFLFTCLITAFFNFFLASSRMVMAIDQVYGTLQNTILSPHDFHNWTKTVCFDTYNTKNLEYLMNPNRGYDTKLGMGSIQIQALVYRHSWKFLVFWLTLVSLFYFNVLNNPSLLIDNPFISGLLIGHLSGYSLGVYRRWRVCRQFKLVHCHSLILG